ncbi:MAG: type 4a pilus biogenesis protein PilO [Armatimonadota bacterium]
MIDIKTQVPRLAVILFSALVILLILAVVGQYTQTVGLVNRIKATRRNLAQEKKTLQQRRAQQAQYENQALVLGNRPPGWDWGDQMPAMVTQVSAIMEGREYRIATLKPDRMTAKGNLLHFPLRIGMRMDLAGLAKVLDDLRDTLPLLAVERITVRNDKGKDGKLSVEMTIGTYVVTDSSAQRPDVGAVLTETRKERKPDDTATAAQKAADAPKAAGTKSGNAGGMR